MYNFNSNKVLITQSNYIPWKGFFDSLQVSILNLIFNECRNSPKYLKKYI